MKAPEEAFRDSVEDTWHKSLGVYAETLDFNKMQTLLFQVIGLQETPKRYISVYANTLLNTFLIEQGYPAEEDAYKQRNAPKPNG